VLELAALLSFGRFIGLLCLGVSIAVSMVATSLMVIWTFNLGVLGIGPTFYSNIARFQLLAIPFFIMAGLRMERCGISQRLVHLAALLHDPVPGGLALVAVVCCVFFAGMSGLGPGRHGRARDDLDSSDGPHAATRSCSRRR
jgi:C4-dicarboxylate transporter, DctM subunit